MSRRIARRLLLVGLLSAALASARIAYANAPTPETLLRSLVPSQAPALLGPITEDGRVGWACKPEKAAESKQWRDAVLP